ncbi:aminotransferase class V-fold PLP-dependent enzyme [Actinoallomurus liliacearum]|uniref:Aminotransferase class V-fold PLP-dependent enzyme n=1 Tax=Actinoallomurus liliacearum TaxID=1080073 RepID=A0ABP8TEQ7_9ACTN
MTELKAEQISDDNIDGDFLARYPDYPLTRRLDELRATDYAYLDAGGHLYLDYGGAGLPADGQISAHAARMRGNCFGNPHSANPTSASATELVERTRARILAHFNASADEYAVIFTPNASGACRLIGESYRFDRETRYVLTLDNHNSVNGIREFARERGAGTEYVPMRGPDLRTEAGDVRAALGKGRGGLFAFPAQSNFTGVQHPLEWIDLAHENGYDVLLDAAAYVPTNRLDLGVTHPDFVPVSWYKVFGYPTGVGCLVARREALARLRRPWFAGGTIQAVSAQGDWHVLADDETAFEDGTLNFLAIPDVAVGIDWVAGIGVDTIHRRVRCLTGRLLDRLHGLRHTNGRPMVEVYGPHDTVRRGGTVTFNFRDPDGRIVDERVVERDSAALGISLRTGCFCNPGAGEAAFVIDRDALMRSAGRRVDTLDDHLRMLGLPSGGAVRVSIGLASNLADVERFVRFAEQTYRDRHPSHQGLTARERC